MMSALLAMVLSGLMGAPTPGATGKGRAAEAPQSALTRVKDITHVVGLGRHKLVGFGLVIGLGGTGDGRRAVFTPRAVANMLVQFGLSVDAEELRLENVAGVMVTAELEPDARVSATLDVTVSSFGDAKSLQGGMLLMTPLQGADGEIYATAQGPLSIGGFNVEAGGEKVQKNHALVGRVAGGGAVVRAPGGDLPAMDRAALSLNLPDYTTARRIAESINRLEGREVARACSAGLVELALPVERQKDPVAFLDEVGACTVEPDASARVVINERTGTVVIGDRVRLLPVAVAHGSLTVEIHAETQVSQPAMAFAREARTAVVQNRAVKAQEENGVLVEMDGNALRDLVRGLNALGVKPRDLIAILQALRAANALQAEIELL
jgi:flagellar P-ring protein precursor FlgI